MENLADSLTDLLYNENFQDVSLEAALSASETRSETLFCLSDHLDRLLAERDLRDPIYHFALTELSDSERRELHLITRPEEERPTPDGKRWRYLCFGEEEARIKHLPGIEAHYYGQAEVSANEATDVPIHAYDKVFVFNHCDAPLTLHDEALQTGTNHPVYVCTFIAREESDLSELMEAYDRSGSTGLLTLSHEMELGNLSTALDFSLAAFNCSASEAEGDRKLAEDSKMVIYMNQGNDILSVYAKTDSAYILDRMLHETNPHTLKRVHPDMRGLLRGHVAAEYRSNQRDIMPTSMLGEPVKCAYIPGCDKLRGEFRSPTLGSVYISYDYTKSAGENVAKLSSLLGERVHAYRELGVSRIEPSKSYRR